MSSPFSSSTPSTKIHGNKSLKQKYETANLIIANSTVVTKTTTTSENNHHKNNVTSSSSSLTANNNCGKATEEKFDSKHIAQNIGKLKLPPVFQSGVDNNNNNKNLKSYCISAKQVGKIKSIFLEQQTKNETITQKTEKRSENDLRSVSVQKTQTRKKPAVDFVKILDFDEIKLNQNDWKNCTTLFELLFAQINGGDQ